MSKVKPNNEYKNREKFKRELEELYGHCVVTEEQHLFCSVYRYTTYECKNMAKNDIPRCSIDNEQRPCTELIEYETKKTKFLKRKKITVLPCKYYENGLKIEDFSFNPATCSMYKNYNV